MSPARYRFLCSSLCVLAAGAISACGDQTPLENRADPYTASITASRAAPSAFYGNFVAAIPQVTVSDRQGKPLPHVTVTFAAIGGGRVTGAEALTDTAGHASPTSWRLGASGTQSLSASATGAAPLTITAAAAAPPPSSFHIEVRYAAGTTPTDAQRAAFDSAAARWSRIILRGGAPYPIHEMDPSCGDLRGETVDGVVITANLKAIDGAGSILGSAGPCILRDEDYLPAQGYMEFDTADLATLEASGQLQEVILHEMAHVLGFGTIWEVNPGNGLPTNAFLLRTPPDDPEFTGKASLEALFGLPGPSGFPWTAVPVENTGGDGTAFAHWREETFGSELMTGWLNAGANPLSALTIAQFRDLGYVVNDALGESYSFTALLQAAGTAPLPLIEGKLPMPILVINRSGRAIATLPRLYK